MEEAAAETGDGAAADLTPAEDDAPAAEEGGPPAEPDVAAADEPADVAAPVTDEERRLARAERFGLMTTEVVQQKKKERAERFGLVTKETVEAKKIERAARFGLITAETEQKKKQDRAARFGLSEAAKKAVSAAAGNGKAKDKKVSIVSSLAKLYLGYQSRSWGDDAFLRLPDISSPPVHSLPSLKAPLLFSPSHHRRRA